VLAFRSPTLLLLSPSGRGSCVTYYRRVCMSYCSLSCASMTAESISGGSNTRRTASSESHGNVGAHESQLGLIGAVGPPREPGFCHLRKGTGMVLQDTLRWWGFLVNGGYACGLCMTNCTRCPAMQGFGARRRASRRLKRRRQGLSK
jgi:hypothetical protein